MTPQTDAASALAERARRYAVAFRREAADERATANELRTREEPGPTRARLCDRSAEESEFRATCYDLYALVCAPSAETLDALAWQCLRAEIDDEDENASDRKAMAAVCAVLIARAAAKENAT